MFVGNLIIHFLISDACHLVFVLFCKMFHTMSFYLKILSLSGKICVVILKDFFLLLGLGRLWYFVSFGVHI